MIGVGHLALGCWFEQLPAFVVKASARPVVPVQSALRSGSQRQLSIAGRFFLLCLGLRWRFC
jgi:hypothetical protein